MPTYYVDWMSNNAIGKPWGQHPPEVIFHINMGCCNIRYLIYSHHKLKYHEKMLSLTSISVAYIILKFCTHHDNINSVISAQIFKMIGLDNNQWYTNNFLTDLWVRWVLYKYPILLFMYTGYPTMQVATYEVAIPWYFHITGCLSRKLLVPASSDQETVKECMLREPNI